MEISEIKSRLTIGQVLTHYSLEADKHNKLCCPFHKDETPSLSVYPNTNTFYCFGCGATGDVIQFIELYDKCSKHEAIIKAGSFIGYTGRMKAPALKPALDFSIEPMDVEHRIPILEKMFEAFKSGLHHHVSVRPQEYLKKRNLAPDLLEIGYNSGQYHYKGKMSEQDQSACIRAGLLIPYSGNLPNGSGTPYTAFAKDCILFALRSKEGRIVSLYGRGIHEKEKGAGKHFYLKDRCGLYPGYPKPGTEKLILTEAIIDAATLLQLPEITKEYEILSCYGTNGLTTEHLSAIKELENLKEVIFFFDGDKPGREAAIKYQDELLNELRSVKVSWVDTPDGEDINSLLQGHSPEIFTHLLESRKEFFLLTENTSIENHSIENPSNEEKKEENNFQEPAQEAPGLNTKNPDFITFTREPLQMIILGGINLQQLDRLRVTLKITRSDSHDPLHAVRHTVDLYHSDYLEKFTLKVSDQLEVSSTVLRRSLSELTLQVEQYRMTRIEGMKEQKPLLRQLSEQRISRAVRYLKAPRLLERTNEDIGKTGVIGEEINRLLMYLVFTSRLREYPLHIVSLGASGSGKTYLQEKVSELIPEQDKLEITILSENAFYYFDRKELRHKLVLIEDMDGAQEVLYPLRELQTKRHISKTVPLKDSKGNLRTITLHVEGPISLAGTTTRERLYEDNANRSLLIYIDNSQDHKEKIMEYQRKVSAGRIDHEKETTLKEFFKDMQSILKPIQVRNPYAEYLKLPEHVFKPLRTNAHYLATIETITFYHQYQREVKTDPHTEEPYIETTLEDIEWANRLLKEVLLAKSDELTKAERSFFESLKSHLISKGKNSFYAREVREMFRMHPSKVKRYLFDLTSYNLLKITGGNRFKSGFEYELLTRDDYTQLENTINTVLDTILSDLKQNLSASSGPGGLSVVQKQNRPLKEKNNSKLDAVVQ